MKGRRKACTDKWLLQELFIKEAKALLATRCNVAGRFLDIAAQAKCEEPIGALAGRRTASARTLSVRT